MERCLRRRLTTKDWNWQENRFALRMKSLTLPMVVPLLRYRKMESSCIGPVPVLERICNSNGLIGPARVSGQLQALHRTSVSTFHPMESASLFIGTIRPVGTSGFSNLIEAQCRG